MTARRTGAAVACWVAMTLPLGASAQNQDAGAPVVGADAGVSPSGEVLPAAPSFVQPVTGTQVEFDSDRPLVSVFVAPGVVPDTTPRYPDPFVKVGRTPVATKLAPGVYTVTAESPDIATGTTTFQVGTAPVHVRVRAGSAGSRSLGSLLIAIGAASLLSALALEISYSSAPSGISKGKIAIPLFVVGGVGFASGLALYLSSGTTIEPDGLKPDRRSAVVGVTSRW